MQFLLTMVLSIEERVFFFQCVFRENKYADLVQEQFAEMSAVYRDRPCTLNELKTAITAYIRNISQADLHKVFAGSGLYQRSWALLPTPCTSAQRLSERTV
jgi:phenylalanyl-tRNA synthetase alpha subunit